MEYHESHSHAASIISIQFPLRLGEKMKWEKGGIFETKKTSIWLRKGVPFMIERERYLSCVEKRS